MPVLDVCFFRFGNPAGYVVHGNVLAVISFPLVGLIFLANLLSFFWIDLIYGVALGIGVPSLIF